MKRTKETYFRDFPSENGNVESSGCREFEGEDLSTSIEMQSMMPANNSSRINRRSGSISKCKRKDRNKSNKDSKIRCTLIRPTNSIE